MTDEVIKKATVLLKRVYSDHPEFISSLEKAEAEDTWSFVYALLYMHRQEIIELIDDMKEYGEERCSRKKPSVA